MLGWFQCCFFLITAVRWCLLPCHPAAPLAFLPGGAYGTTAGTQSEIAGLQQVLPQAAASSLRAALGRGCLHYVYRLAFQEPEGLEMIGKRSMNVLLTACLKSLTLQRACTTIAILSLSVVKFLNATSSGGLTTFLFLKSSCLCEIALFRWALSGQHISFSHRQNTLVSHGRAVAPSFPPSL